MSRKLIKYARRNNIKKIKKRLEKGDDINFQDKIGDTALMWAVLGRNVKAVEFLLDNNADPNLRNKKGFTALEYAVIDSERNVKLTPIVKLLLENGADVHAKNVGGVTLLAYAAYKGSIEVVELLLEKRRQLESGIYKFPFFNAAGFLQLIAQLPMKDGFSLSHAVDRNRWDIVYKILDYNNNLLN